MHGSSIKVMDSWALCVAFKIMHILNYLLLYRRLLDAYGSTNIQIWLQSYKIYYPKAPIMIHKHVHL